MTSPAVRVGIFGAGKAGSQIARLALAAGHPVRITTTAPPAHAQAVLDIVAPGATASSAEQMIADSDIIILAVPLSRLHSLPLALLAGRVVVDAMNYWPALDGTLPDFDGSDRPSSVIVRDALPADTRLVKTFNHLGYHQLEDLPRLAGDPERAALAVASDDPEAAAVVAAFVDRIGFDPVLAGPLADSRVLEPDGPLFGRRLTRAQAGALLRAPVASRPSRGGRGCLSQAGSMRSSAPRGSLAFSSTQMMPSGSSTSPLSWMTVIR